MRRWRSWIESKENAPALGPSSCVLADLEFSTEIFEALGTKLLHLGQVDQADLLIRAALNGRIKLYGKDHPITAKSYNARARLNRIKGDVVQAEKDVRRALAINSRIHGEDGYGVVVNLTELAIIQCQAGEFAGAEKAAIRGLRILERLYLEESDPNTTRLLDVLARVLQMKGLYTDAVELYQRILQQDAKDPGREHSLKYATHQANFALVLLSQRSYTDAERFYTQAIDIYEKHAGLPQHPDLLDIRSGYVSLLAEMKRPEAVDQYRELIRLGSQLRGANHPYVGNDHAGLGRAIYQLEQANFLDNAKAEFERALAIYQANVPEQMPEDHAFIAEAKGWKARILVEQAGAAGGGDRAKLAGEAEALALRALEKFQAEFAEDSVEVAITRAIIGRALALQEKDGTRALGLLTAAQPIVVAARGADSRIAKLIAQWIAEPQKKIC